MIAGQILFSTDSFVSKKGKHFGSMQELEQLRFAGRVWEAICGFLFSQQGRGAERESAPADSAVQTVAQRDSIKPKSPRRKRGLFACRAGRHAQGINLIPCFSFRYILFFTFRTVLRMRTSVAASASVLVPLFD